MRVPGPPPPPPLGLLVAHVAFAEVAGAGKGGLAVGVEEVVPKLALYLLLPHAIHQQPPLLGALVLLRVQHVSIQRLLEIVSAHVHEGLVNEAVDAPVEGRATAHGLDGVHHLHVPAELDVHLEMPAIIHTQSLLLQR